MENLENKKIAFQDFYSILKGIHGTLGKWWPGKREEIIVSAVLTQNTNWKNVERALNNIKEVCSGDILICLHNLPDEQLTNLIRPAGFYNIKAKRLRQLLNWLANYEFKLDKIAEKDAFELRKELLEINGIGKETADSIILYAFEKPIFVIDAYTKRLLKRIFGIEFSNYDEYREFFEDNYKKTVELYQEFHGLIVEHAKLYCTSKPKCDICPIDFCLFNHQDKPF
ncbi:MAG TPA: endonuclease [Fervidobacterium nodosum]|nr:endonuclease [Fervidobacterium nodosum]